MPPFIELSGGRSPSRWRPVLLILLTLVTVGGCTSFLPGSEEADKEDRLKELMRVPDPPELIRDATAPFGMQAIEVEGVGAVNGLPGTGGPADPSGYRDQLLEEMKRHDVIDPNHFLESGSTALVRVRATVPPGAQRGDPLDIRILAPPESRVSDLHYGWLLDTRLRQQQVVQNMIRQSEVMAIGVGPVLTRADYTPGEDATLKIEGNVLSGGRVQKSRKLGLILRPKYQHAKMSKQLSEAINRRFFFFDGTTRRGIAKPLEDDFIEIELHPRYRDNVRRMMQVVQAIGGQTQTSDTQTRLTELSRKLQDPATAADAALQLEALGESAVPTLLSGLESTNRELRFYAAEALAYLDRNEAIGPLEEAARQEAAFRYPALLAMQGLENHAAVGALRRLMNEPSIETRYGAFCSIRRRVDGKQSLLGRPVGPFWLYQVSSTASPSIIVSLRESPEIVLLGTGAPLQIPQFLRVGGLIIKPDAGSPGRLKISHFQLGKEDQKILVPNDAASVIQGIVKVGGGYGDVIAVLRQAKAKAYLLDQLAIDPTPKAMRTYYRDQDEQQPEQMAARVATTRDSAVCRGLSVERLKETRAMS